MLFSFTAFIICFLVLFTFRATKKINGILTDYLQSAAQNGIHHEIPEILKLRDDDIGKAVNALECIFEPLPHWTSPVQFSLLPRKRHRAF
jgi:hypothetical protein